MQEKLKPMVRARRMKMYLDSGMSITTVAEKFECGVATVENMVKLTTLHPDLQDAIDLRKIPLRYALKLSGEPHEKQQRILQRLLNNDAASGSRAARYIDAEISGKHISSYSMRNKEFLERWYCVLKSRRDIKLDGLDVLAFVLGEPAPENRDFQTTLQEVKFRPRRYEK